MHLDQRKIGADWSSIMQLQFEENMNNVKNIGGMNILFFFVLYFNLVLCSKEKCGYAFEAIENEKCM